MVQLCGFEGGGRGPWSEESRQPLEDSKAPLDPPERRAALRSPQLYLSESHIRLLTRMANNKFVLLKLLSL